MREAIGGAMTLEIIIVFLVLVNSYLAFSVNYTRAFRVKNAIIDLIENYEGFPVDGVSCNGTNSSSSNPEFNTKFCNIIRSYGYNSPEFARNDCGGTDQPGGVNDIGVCIFPHVNINNQTSGSDSFYGIYYTVYTYIDIDLPILNRVLQAMPNIFRITGDTNIIYTSGQKNIYVGGK
jgi:hypothetical protein